LSKLGFGLSAPVHSSGEPQENSVSPLKYLLLDLSPDDLKISVLSGCLVPSDGERSDCNRPLYDVNRVDEIPKILFAPLRNDLDLPVFEICHVSRDIPVKRLVVHMLSIADPLNTPACNGHKPSHSILLYVAGINSFAGPCWYEKAWVRCVGKHG